MQDLVDQHLRDNKEHAAMQQVMGGTFAQQIICRSVPHRSEKDEEFYQASCDSSQQDLPVQQSVCSDICCCL